MLPPIGTHRSRASGPLVVYEAKSGALCIAIPVSFEIGAGEQDGWTWSGKHTMTIFKSDGEAMIDNINTLREVFDWDGFDPFLLAQTEDGTPRDLSAKEFNIVGAHEEFIPEGAPEGSESRTAFKIKWLNPLSRVAKMPEAGDRKAILTKYGSKLRALAGPKSAKPEPKLEVTKPEPKKESKPPTAPSKAPPQTAGGQPVTSTMEETWAALVKANPGANEQDLGDKFWAVVGEVANGKQNSDLTIQEWGKVKTKLVG